MPRYEVVVQTSSRMRVIAYAACRGMADGPVWGSWSIKVEQFPASGLLEYNKLFYILTSIHHNAAGRDR